MTSFKHSVTSYNPKMKQYEQIPALTTAWVCAEVPDAMFVNAQAASNCKAGLKQQQQ
jgi:hypothetical protein